MNKKDFEKVGITKAALEKAGLTEDVIDQLIVIHGKDIESHKKQVTTAEAQVTTLTDQLEAANTQIQDFKSMDIEQIKKAATDWEKTAKDEAKARTDEVTQLRKQHAVEKELKETYGVLDPADLLHRLDLTAVKVDGDKVTGLKEQVEPYKETKAYLFSSQDDGDDGEETESKTTPKLVTGAKQKVKPAEKSLSQAIGERLGVKSET